MTWLRMDDTAGPRAGHHIEVTAANTYRHYRRVSFACRDCDLRGYVKSSPPATADTFVADLMAVHWGSTGGDVC